MSECKFQLLEDLVSYDGGVLWESQDPPVYQKGYLLEPDSPDCDGYDGYEERWIPVDGGYICEGNNKYVREILQISNDGGVTWYPSNPLIARPGTFVKVDEEFCSYLFEGHYEYSATTTSGSSSGTGGRTCPAGTTYNRTTGGCTRRSSGGINTGSTWTGNYLDPLKIIKCNGRTSITTADTRYYDPNNWYLASAKIGNCASSIDSNAFYGGSSYLRTRTLRSIDFTDATSLLSIGGSAFRSCNNISAVTIPDNVTSIGGYAFEYCSGLTSVTIGSGITSIGGAAFYGCSGLTGITINAMTPPTIGSTTFDNTNNCQIVVPCESVTDYVSANNWTNYQHRIIGNSPCSVLYKLQATYSGGETYELQCSTATSITRKDITGSSYSYSSMTNILIGDCVSSIGISAFTNCTSLGGISIPSGVTSIGDRAFTDSTSLQSITIGSNSQLASIGNIAFSGCTSLKSIDIPNSVTSIGTSAFTGCYRLSSCTIGNSVTSINEGTFQGCIGLRNITIGSNVATIGQNAFDNCTHLTNVEIPDSVSIIESQAFKECINIASVTIGSGVTSIGGWAFYRCSGITSMTINAETPPQVEGVNSGTFYGNYPIYVPCGSAGAYMRAWNSSSINSRIQEMPGCEYEYKWRARYYDSSIQLTACDSTSAITSGEIAKSNLVSVEIGDCVSTIGDDAFSGYTMLTSCTISSGVTNIGNRAFTYCPSLKSIDIPDNVTSIGDSIFSGCTRLTACTIGNGATSIGSSAFYNCTRLTSCTIGSGVTSIGDNAFYSASSLTNIDIPDSVTSIGDSAFYRCSGITNCTIGSGITSIGNSAFYYCRSLASVTVNAITPPTLGSSVFSFTNNCPLYVPAGSLSLYQSAWSTYANRIQAIP